MAHLPFIPASVRVSRRTTENVHGQHGLLRLLSGHRAVNNQRDLIDDELKDLRQRASLLHLQQMQLYGGTQGRNALIQDLSKEVYGSTRSAIRALKAENADLRARGVSKMATDAHPGTPRSPRSKGVGGAAEDHEKRQMEIEAALQRQLARLKEENARLRAQIGD